jgi:pectinesterase
MMKNNQKTKCNKRWIILIVLSFILYHFSFSEARAASRYDNPDTLVVARDGTGQFRNVSEAIEVCRAFMEYHKVIYVKKGTYKEKLIVPQWLTNIEICGEDRDKTVITWDDHANITIAQTPFASTTERPILGTFRSYTLKIEGSLITLKNITVENNAARLGQAVALMTTGDKLKFINCRFLGNQDTVYTGAAHTRLYFKDCYIEGTTDFIFGPSTAWFEGCDIFCKINSYITAASTPADVKYGYVFNNCRITCGDEATKVYLGRPWRDYGYTLFMNCQLPRQIRPEGWHHWQKEREKTARYLEYNNTGDGANATQRVPWSRQLTKQEAQKITPNEVFSVNDKWMDYSK